MNTLLAMRLDVRTEGPSLNGRRTAATLRLDASGFPPPQMARCCCRLMLCLVLIGCVCNHPASALLAQEPVEKVEAVKKPLAPGKEDLTQAPATVDVKPVARDEEISTRLQKVLDATGWFVDPQVRVEEGVVFLNGRTETDDLKKWAGDLARNTQDVVAVANRMEVLEPAVWDFSPAWDGLHVL